MTAVPDAPSRTSDQPADRSGTERLAAVSGLGAVAALVAAIAVVPADPGGTAPSDIAARYADGSAGYLRAAALEGLSVGLFVVFAAVLGVVLSRAVGRTSGWPAAATGGAGVAAALHLVGYAAITTLAAGTAATGDEAVVLAVYDLSAAAFALGSAGLAVFLAAVAVLVLRTRVLWRAVGWAAGLLAPLCLATAVSLGDEGVFSLHGDLGFLTLVLVHLWILGTAIALLRRRPEVG